MGDPRMNIHPGAIAQVGDLVFVHGQAQVVTEIRTYAANSPEALAVTTMKEGYVVRAVVTPGGIRYFGHLPGERYRGQELSVLRPEGVSFEATDQ